MCNQWSLAPGRRFALSTCPWPGSNWEPSLYQHHVTMNNLICTFLSNPPPEMDPIQVVEQCLSPQACTPKGYHHRQPRYKREYGYTIWLHSPHKTRVTGTNVTNRHWLLARSLCSAVCPQLSSNYKLSSQLHVTIKVEYLYVFSAPEKDSIEVAKQGDSHLRGDINHVTSAWLRNITGQLGVFKSLYRFASHRKG